MSISFKIKFFANISSVFNSNISSFDSYFATSSVVTSSVFSTFAALILAKIARTLSGLIISEAKESVGFIRPSNNAI